MVKKKRSKSSSVSKKRKIFFAKLFLNLFIYLSSLSTVVFLSLFFVLVKDLPPIEILEHDDTKPTIAIYGSDNTLLATYGDAYGDYLPYSKFPKYLIEAIISTEDKRFFSHPGIDIFGILRAAYYNQIAGRFVQGGSTITQQLSKIIFLSSEKSLKRKLQEAMLSFRLESIFSKEQILTMYLNRVFLGRGAFGVDAASRSYFKKSIRDISLGEAAMIAAMLKAPSKYSSEQNEIALMERTKLVLSNMAKDGFISDETLKHTELPKIYRENQKHGSLKNPYFTDFIIDELQHIINPSQRLNIYTTLIPFLQEKLELSIDTIMRKFADKKDVTQAAAVLMSNDGKIIAMVGGRSYAQSQFNRAVKAKRQPGSVFKLFVYLAALENEFSPSDILDDFPIEIGGWVPKNISGKSVGYISLEEAFIKSNNIATVKIAEKVGRVKISNMASRFGIKNVPTTMPSISLGSYEVALIDITASYAAIANKGVFNKPLSILKIKTMGGNILYNADSLRRAEQRPAISPDIVRTIDTMLRNTVLVGTGKKANLHGHNIRGKTGTSQDHRDALFIGYNYELTLGIWVGNDDNEPMNGVTGATIPALIFKEFFSGLYHVAKAS